MAEHRREEETVLGIDEKRTPHAVLAVGLVAATVFMLSPTDSALQIAAWFVPPVMAMVLHVRHFLRSPTTVKRPLGWLVAGTMVYLGASAFWYLLPTVFETPLPFPSLLDVTYFVAYALFAVFLILVIRRQRAADPVDSRLAVVDALILTAAMSAVA